MKPMPPRPLFHGSRTASAKAVATTASTADPPAAKIAAPAAAATPFWEATMPPREAATGFRTTQFCINCGISDHLDRIDAAFVEGVMTAKPRRLVIGRAIGPDSVLRARFAAVELDRPVRAIALERAIGVMLGRPHQIEPHILFRDVMHHLVAGLLAAHGMRRVGDGLAGEGDAHAPRLGQQIDAVLGLFHIAGGGVRHGLLLSIRQANDRFDVLRPARRPPVPRSHGRRRPRRAGPHHEGWFIMPSTTPRRSAERAGAAA